MFLSKGWLEFVRDNSLLVGDACVFELIKDLQDDELMLKVHIFRLRVEENSTALHTGSVSELTLSTGENCILQFDESKHTESSDAWGPVSSDRTYYRTNTKNSFTSQWEKSVVHGIPDYRPKRGRPRAAEANRATNLAKMLMPENPYFMMTLEEYNVVRNYTLKIPTGFTDYKNGTIPRKVSLRDRFGNMWPIGVINPGRDYYFQHGWKKFIEDNTVEFEDILVFDYDGKGTFDVKLLGRTGCEKKGVGGEKKENEMNVEHQKSVKPKRKNWACDSSNNSSDDDSDEDYMVEEEEEDEKYEVVVEEEDDEEEDEKEEEEEIEKSQRLRRRYVEEEEEDEDDEEEEETEEENEEENERAGTFKKNLSRSKAGCKKAATRKVKDHHGQFGADIFKSGRATQPKNPYFVANIRSNKRYHLNVPIDVVRDYKLELPERMTIRDSAGRKFKTEVEIWKDGRIWLIGGWRSLCGWNLVQKNDKGIFEFVRGKGNKGLYLQVQVLREGTSSHPNKKNKK